MNDIKDTIQVGIANGSAIGFSITDCNEILTLVSLVLAIAFTIYKFIKTPSSFNKVLTSSTSKFLKFLVLPSALTTRAFSVLLALIKNHP